MVKHVIFNAIYSVAVIYAMAFAGEYWLPEEEDHLNLDGKVFPGRPTTWSNEPLYE